MPWTSKDATHSTKKAKSAKAKRQWAHVANAELKKGVPEGKAKMIANGVLRKRRKK